jgi:hypothetical protein
MTAFPVEKSFLAPLISLFFFVRFFFLKRTKGSALPARLATSSGKSKPTNTSLTQRQIDQEPKNLAPESAGKWAETTCFR